VTLSNLSNDGHLTKSTDGVRAVVIQSINSKTHYEIECWCTHTHTHTLGAYNDEMLMQLQQQLKYCCMQSASTAGHSN